MNNQTLVVIALLAIGVLTGRSRPVRAQSLDPGQIAIVGYESDPVYYETFAFVTLKTLDDSGREICFTDRGWEGDEFWPLVEHEGSTCFEVWYSGQDVLPAGSVIVWSDLEIELGGDQIFAYDGNIDGSGDFTGTLLYGYQNSGTGWQDWMSDPTHTSVLPPALAGANVAMTTYHDNYAYTGITTGTEAELLAAINDPANWTGSDDSTIAFPTWFTVEPAAVTLLDFAATRADHGVLLSWRTGSELACGAFAILRCDRSDGACAGVADHVELDGLGTPCRDDPAGAWYQLLDTTAAADTAYSYYLREYETSGGIEHYGPAVVDVVGDDGAPPTELGWGADGGPGGCAISTRRGRDSAPFLILLLAAIVARRSRRKRAA